jgi:hypothetical protein
MPRARSKRARSKPALPPARSLAPVWPSRDELGTAHVELFENYGLRIMHNWYQAERNAEDADNNESGE